MKDQLRILHTESSVGWGGQELRILKEAALFREQGYALIIACNNESKLFYEAKKLGFITKAINIKRKTPLSLISVICFLRRVNPDLVVAHSSTDHWLVSLARLVTQSRFPIVRIRHVSAKISPNAATKWLYRRGADAVVTTSSEIRQHVINTLKLPESRVFFIPTGISPSVFYPGDRDCARGALRIPSDIYLFGTVSTLRSWKGHMDLINAFQKLDEPKTMLIIVGDGPQKAALSAYVAERHLGRKVLFLGHQSDVRPYLDALDCFVFPSYANEGVPQALLQAMGHGLDIIASDIDGVTEALKNYKKKSIFQRRHVRELAQKMSGSTGAARQIKTLEPRSGHYPYLESDILRLSRHVYNFVAINKRN